MTTTRPTITAIYTLDPKYTEPKLVEVIKAWSSLEDRRSFAHIESDKYGKGSYDCVPFDSLEF